MSGQQIQPVQPRDAALEPYQEGDPPGDWGGSSADAAPEPKGPNLRRYLAAVNRFKWLVLLLLPIGGAAGYAATRFIEPEYEVQATILLEQGTGVNNGAGRGPIQAAELLQASGWQDLLRSYAIADPVVMGLGLFVTPVADADSVLFRQFRVDQTRLRPGDYKLTIAGGRYVLSLKPGIEVEKGAVGDSIGRPVGFQWQPASTDFGRRATVEFNVQTPREASRALIKKLSLSLQTGSSFLFLRMTGPNAQRSAATLNAWVEQFVTVATQYKKQNVVQVAGILEGQREYAAQELAGAESALESFRVRTVTEPSERQTITPGIEMTNSPVFENYFRDKILSDNYRRDREALERILQSGRSGTPITREAVLSVPAVNADPAADNLRKALEEQAAREFELRRLRETYTDEYQRVKDAQAALAGLRDSVVPRALNAYLGELRLREQTLNATIDQSSRDLKGIPSRTIEEQRLKRQVDVAARVYESLNMKAAEAKLAEASTVPDVSILDAAVPPLAPTRNTAPMIILGAIGGALALGIALAILLDQVDKRFRYPEQVTDDLGLFVLGVVPVIGGKGRRKAEQAAQVVEAFRTIRMNVRYAADPSRPLAMTITSPGPNDGKSLISSNLALSFAESGLRTLLIDGDIRRGELAKTFNIHSRPGLVEYLEGTALIAEVLNPLTSHANLTLMPAGVRRRRAPELLATPRLSQLLNQMTSEFDVVIVDSPPLGAGYDAYALATATGNMALVMRAGVTDRKMAAAKMATVDTLPIRVMGAVLNGIKMTGVYQYYSYYQDYAATDEEQSERLPSGRGAARPAALSGGIGNE
ncbi:polysaccharide biosynthesis tyrosine autokinase [Gemmatimonas aurantiaca]|uniref:polysaccharide biosynthesis tyrosine autokinase n=1 Tax=Gemmatimonas aurantiaca TaxID=173480 RepID=UPI00301BCD16